MVWAMPLSKTHEKMLVFWWKFNPSQLKCMKIQKIHENTWKIMKINENSWKLQISIKSTKDMHIVLLIEPPRLQKVAPGEPKWAPRAPKMPQNYQKMICERINKCINSIMCPRVHKINYKNLQDASKLHQDDPKVPQMSWKIYQSSILCP